MILRRVIEHVKAQNWTAVAIDFVIVVAGVFVGIQVSHWNAAQADRQRAYGYLERIRDDLDADLDGYMNRVRFWSDVMDQGRLALDYAASDDADRTSDWNILLAFFQASQVGEHVVTDSTYEELKSAGELRLIGDAALRDALAYYYVNSNNPVMRAAALSRTCPRSHSHRHPILCLGGLLYSDSRERTGTGGLPRARRARTHQRHRRSHQQ